MQTKLCRHGLGSLQVASKEPAWLLEQEGLTRHCGDFSAPSSSGKCPRFVCKTNAIYPLQTRENVFSECFS